MAGLVILRVVPRHDGAAVYYLTFGKWFEDAMHIEDGRFAGHGNEAALGTLERADLTAAFGASR